MNTTDDLPPHAFRPTKKNRVRLDQQASLPWKPAIFARLRAAFRGPKHAVIEALTRLAGSDGVCWVSVETLARDAGVDPKTARKHLHSLMDAGSWLRAESMTWVQLAAHRRAAGKPEPRQTSHRQAPYLFTILDGLGKPASLLPNEQRKPARFARWGQPARLAHATTPEPRGTRAATPNHSQIWEPSTLPLLEPEYSDPLDQNRRSEEQQTPDPEPHTSSVQFEGENHPGPTPPNTSTDPESSGEPRSTWQTIVTQYAEHFEGKYFASPAGRAIPTETQRQTSDHLDKKAESLAKRLHITRKEARDKLLMLALSFWFERKGTGDFLDRTAHPLWAFCEEICARTHEAFKALVHEHAVATNPIKPRQTTAPAPKPPRTFAESLAQCPADLRAKMAAITTGKLVAPAFPQRATHSPPKIASSIDTTHAERPVTTFAKRADKPQQDTPPIHENHRKTTTPDHGFVLGDHVSTTTPRNSGQARRGRTVANSCRVEGVDPLRTWHEFEGQDKPL